MKRISAIALTFILALSLSAAPAFGQGSSARGYDESLGVIGEIQSEEPATEQETERQPTPTPGTPPQREGDLPFTGLDVGIVALMGALLVGTGVALRRTARRGSS
ncbi:MAG TPA: hypothetical protein VHF89_05305 [Solirubrobacteraceae bacterium]|nr:hypothetical protein [Solirubrobacteraceae bacterium]